MSLFGAIGFALSVCLIGVILAGLISRKLYRACYAFPCHLTLVLLGDALMLLWPDRFYRLDFWMAKESVHGLTRLAIALEIMYRAYQSFPRAAAAVRRLVLVALAVSLWLLMRGLQYGTDVRVLVGDLQPRLANGTVLVFLAVWLLILWYRLPIHRLHRAILRGFVPYLLVFTGALSLITLLGWKARAGVSVVQAVSYHLILIYWLWEVWRDAPRDSAFLRSLQPWRARL